MIQRIVSGWPRALDGRHVEALGFTADTGIDEVVEAFVEDDLRCRSGSPARDRHPYAAILTTRSMPMLHGG